MIFISGHEYATLWPDAAYSRQLGEILCKSEDGDFYRQPIPRLVKSFEIGKPEEIVR